MPFPKKMTPKEKAKAKEKEMGGGPPWMKDKKDKKGKKGKGY